MSNYQVQPIDKPAALTTEAIKSLRKQQVQGLSRRQLLRVALGTGIGLWLLEVTAGTVAFAWPNLKGGFGAPIAIGDLEAVKLQNSTLPIDHEGSGKRNAPESLTRLIDRRIDLQVRSNGRVLTIRPERLFDNGVHDSVPFDRG